MEIKHWKGSRDRSTKEGRKEGMKEDIYLKEICMNKGRTNNNGLNCKRESTI